MDTHIRGINQDITQELNRSLVLNLLRERGICSRANISELTGLRQATVTNIVNDLIGWGLVRETGFINGSKGRRSIGIAINTSIYCAVGVRLARKYFCVGVFNLLGKELRSVRVETAGNSPTDTLDQIKAKISELAGLCGQDGLRAIGIALPGPFLTNEGRIALMTEVPGWQTIYIKDELEQTFGVPVLTEHDANAGAFAQYYWYDDAKKPDTLVYVAAGQGLGAGILHRGALFNGSQGTAGEIGHMTIDYNGPKCECGNRGCLEKYCTSLVLAKKVGSRLGRELSVAQTFDEVRSGRPEALEEYENACALLGIGLVSVVNAFNPDVLILGDEMSHVRPDIMLDTVAGSVLARTMPDINGNLEIKISSVTSGSILTGAGIIAVNEALRQPASFAQQAVGSVAAKE